MYLTEIVKLHVILYPPLWCCEVLLLRVPVFTLKSSLKTGITHAFVHKERWALTELVSP